MHSSWRYVLDRRMGGMLRGRLVGGECGGLSSGGVRSGGVYRGWWGMCAMLRKVLRL
jgi:hypothetical protein